MTFQNIFEQIFQIFPELGETQIKMDINSAYLDYCNKTELLSNYYEETPQIGVVSYYLPDDVNAIYDVKFFDVNGKELTGSNTLKFSIDQGAITFYNYFGSDIQEIPSNIGKIVYYYTATPSKLIDDSQSPLVPDEFHSALVSGVLKDYFAKFKIDKVMQDGNIIKMIDLNVASYHDREYQKKVIEGKKYALKNKNSLAIHINHKGF